jgi:DNA repair protein RecO (recombination protein O)
MRARERVQLEPCFVLHGRDWHNTSRIVDLFSRSQGRITLIARGARRPTSPWRALLMPFRPLLVSFSLRGELGMLLAAEAASAPLEPSPDRLLAGFYANELLLRGMSPHDPHADLFDHYGSLLADLAGQEDEAVLLRRFELGLLDALGYGARLDHDGASGTPLLPDAWYRLDPLAGLRRVDRVGETDPDADCCRGADLLALAAGRPDSAAARGPLRRALRGALDQALGSRPLRSRAVARALRRGPKLGGGAA